MGGFTSGGLKLQSSVASTMIGMMPAAGAAGPYVVAIMGAIAFIAEVVEWMSNDDTMEKALRKIEEAINHIYFLLDVLDRRLDEMILQVAIESNRQTLRDLKDYLDEVRDVKSQLRNLPTDVNTLITITNRAGIIIDKFLRDDYDIWRWTDVVLKTVRDGNGEPILNPRTGQYQEEPALSLQQFKNLPTLPVYLVAVTTWLTARERVVQLGGVARLDDDTGRVRRHLNAVTVRSDFNEFEMPPQSLPEHIQSLIRAFIHSSNRYPEDRICHFWFDVQNWMSGEQKHGGTFELLMDNNNVLCTCDPSSIASPLVELEWEEAAGTASLEAIRATLERVALSGSARKPFVGRFPTETYSKANYYGVNAPGELVWFEHLWHSGQPGTPATFAGPRKLADGWNRYRSVLPAGGKSIYAIDEEGNLDWYRHDGAFDGTTTMTGPVRVGWGWHGYTKVIAGGNGVLYGMKADGKLFWYRHEGFEDGGDVHTFRGPVEVGSGWTMFDRIFSAGDNTLYGVKPDGTLMWYFHKGAIQGTYQWESPMQVGNGWQNFAHIFGVGDGIIYAVQPDGQVLWYQHETWKNGGEIRFVTIGGQRHPLSIAPVPYWKGPVTVNDDRARYIHMFGLIPKPLPYGGGVR